MRFDRYKESSMYDVADVWGGFRYWFDKLLAYCLNIFEYEGLPDTLPAKELESNLLLTDHAVVFRVNGKPYTCYTSLTGFDAYYNPTAATYAQPRLGSGTLALQNYPKPSEEMRKGVIIYNCDLQHSVLGSTIDGSLYSFISRYARQLSDLESTANIKTVNNRAPYMATADDDNVRNSVVAFFRKLVLGKREVVSDSSIVPNLKAIELSSDRSTEKVIDIILARDKILEQFYREIGVRFYQSKRAQVNTEEVSANDDMLLISLDDMLRAREEGIEEVNKTFNLNIKVKLNEAFAKSTEEDYENTDDQTRLVERGAERKDNNEVQGDRPDDQGDTV